MELEAEVGSGAGPVWGQISPALPAWIGKTQVTSGLAAGEPDGATEARAMAVLAQAGPQPGGDASARRLPGNAGDLKSFERPVLAPRGRVVARPAAMPIASTIVTPRIAAHRCGGGAHGLGRLGLQKPHAVSKAALMSVMTPTQAPPKWCGERSGMSAPSACEPTDSRRRNPHSSAIMRAKLTACWLQALHATSTVPVRHSSRYAASFG